MRRFGLYLALLGMATATHAVEPVAGFFAPGLDLLTVQIVQSDARGLVRPTPYRLTLSIVPIRAADTVTYGFGPTSASVLNSAVERQRDIAGSSVTNRTQFFDVGRASLPPLLRLESNGERLEIRPRRRSVSVQWSKTFD